MRTKYTVEELQNFAEAYNIGTIQKSSEFESGLENSNYFIETSQGRYVIRVFEGPGMTPETIRFEVEIMQSCAEGGVKVPRIFPNTKGEFLTSLKGREGMLMEFIEGDNAYDRSISDTLAAEIGGQAGKMDTLLSKYTDPSRVRQNFEYDMRSFPKLAPTLEKLAENM